MDFFCKNTGDNTGKFDLVHIQSVIDLFAKQLNNALNVHWTIKRRAKSQKDIGTLWVVDNNLAKIGPFFVVVQNAKFAHKHFWWDLGFWNRPYVILHGYRTVDLRIWLVS